MAGATFQVSQAQQSQKGLPLSLKACSTTVDGIAQFRNAYEKGSEVFLGSPCKHSAAQTRVLDVLRNWHTLVIPMPQIVKDYLLNARPESPSPRKIDPRTVVREMPQSQTQNQTWPRCRYPIFD